MRVAKGLSFEDSFNEGVGSLCFNNPPSDPNTQALGSSGSIPLQERNDPASEDHDIFLNNFKFPSDDLNSLRRVGSCSISTMLFQERIEVI